MKTDFPFDKKKRKETSLQRRKKNETEVPQVSKVMKGLVVDLMKGQTASGHVPHLKFFLLEKIYLFLNNFTKYLSFNFVREIDEFNKN